VRRPGRGRVLLARPPPTARAGPDSGGGQRPWVRHPREQSPHPAPARRRAWPG